MQVHSTQPVTPEQAEIFLSTLARRSAEKFVNALRAPTFTDVARGKIFGVVPKDVANNELGDLIYKCWIEIYSSRLQHSDGETLTQGDQGLASNAFCEELTAALLSAQLAPTFERWVNELALSNDESKINASCKSLKEKQLDLSFLIHPTDKTHREFMERFRDKKL